MKDTSCGEKCPFFKQGFCGSEKECPNYIESWWVEGQNQEPTLIRDCAPKRMLLQQQLMQSRIESLQSALEQQRNEHIRLGAYLGQLIEMSKTVIEQKGTQYEKISYDA